MIDVAAVEPVAPDIAAPPMAAAAPETAPASCELDIALPEAEAPAAERVLPEIEHPIGPLRQAVLDHLIDTADAGPQSVAQIIAAMPVGTSRGSAESAIKREFDSGRVIRTSPGHYVLAPAVPPKPAPTPAEEALLFDALERWALDPVSWNVAALGPAPDDENTQISLDIRRRFFDRVRKREQRRRDAEAAAARQAAADHQLLRKLLAATNGNFYADPEIEDLTVIKRVIETVPLGHVITTVRSKVDHVNPENPPLHSWRDVRLLTAIATDSCQEFMIPAMVKDWSRAGLTPQKIDDTPKASPSTLEPAEPERAPATPPPQPGANQRSR